MDLQSWAGSINLDTPAGRLLQRLAGALPKDPLFQITVFGSSPIQITVDAALASADVDLFSDWPDLGRWVKEAGLSSDDSEFYIQVSTELNFRTSPRWRTRAQSVRVENCEFIFPHPLDILIAKLNRLDEKDLEAFRIVIRKTGHPTEEELIHELRMAVDLFRPGFDEEQNLDFGLNCRRLWLIVFGREIDPRREIIGPALEMRRRGYGESGRDYGTELREAAAAYRVRPE